MQGLSTISITTRSSRSKTVMSNCDAMQPSDMNMFWKIQHPTKNDMVRLADIVRWNFPATKKSCLGETAVTSATPWPIGRKEKPDHNTPASVETRSKTKNRIAVWLLQDAQSPSLQMIQGNLEPNSLNAPTRTMLAVMVETSMSNFKRCKTKYGNAKAAKELAEVIASFTARRTSSPRLVFSLNLPFASLTLRIRLLTQEGKLMLHVRPILMLLQRVSTNCPAPFSA